MSKKFEAELEDEEAEGEGEEEGEEEEGEKKKKKKMMMMMNKNTLSTMGQAHRKISCLLDYRNRPVNLQKQWMLFRGNAMARHLFDPSFHCLLLPRENVRSDSLLLDLRRIS